MEIKFIGTGSGKTSLKRFHSSFLITSYDFKLLVDAGDGISKALLSLAVPFDQIDGILFSHLHPDHFSGIGTLLVQMKLIKRKRELKIFIHESLVEAAKSFILSSYLFHERMDFDIVYCGFLSDEEIAVSKEIKFTARQNTHLDPYTGYDKEGKLSFSCSSFLFSIGNKNVFYTGDVGKPEDLYLFKDMNISIIISEATHIEPKYFTAVYEDLGPEKLILTHISGETEEKLISWKSALSDKIRADFVLASDGMTIDI